ncbi:hypothetical protein EVA_16867 [gut metagenome]|uniref:Uncharacterized protein n=1 Tax=gut metagenome TaxID=749906 RepID=J9FKV6_9ZZZZ
MFSPVKSLEAEIKVPTSRRTACLHIIPTRCQIQSGPNREWTAKVSRGNGCAKFSSAFPSCGGEYERGNRFSFTFKRVIKGGTEFVPVRRKRGAFIFVK